MSHTLTADSLRVDFEKGSSIYFRTRGGNKQVVATGDDAKAALTEIWGQPNGKDERDYPLWELGS